MRIRAKFDRMLDLMEYENQGKINEREDKEKVKLQKYFIKISRKFDFESKMELEQGLRTLMSVQPPRNLRDYAIQQKLYHGIVDLLVEIQDGQTEIPSAEIQVTDSGLFESIKTTFQDDLKSNLEFFPEYRLQDVCQAIYDQINKKPLYAYYSAYQDFDQVQLDADVDEIMEKLKKNQMLRDLDIDYQWRERIEYMLLQYVKDGVKELAN